MIDELKHSNENKSTKIHSQPDFHFMSKVSFLSLLIIVGLACENPFSTREAEPPDAQTPSTFVSPTNPEFVFVNLQFAVSERNVENYIRSFVDSTRSQQRFSFVPDQGVQAVNPGTFVDWNLENERHYLSQVLQATPGDSVRSLSFAEESSSETSGTATFTQNYELIFEHSQKGNIPTVFRGQSKFWLERNDTGDWAIYRWEDFTNGVDPSWSELKALFR